MVALKQHFFIFDCALVVFVLLHIAPCETRLDYYPTPVSLCVFSEIFVSGFWQGMSPDESDDIWADMHKLLAPYMHQCILDVQGMWVKTGQYLSSRADVMPQPYIDEL